MSDTTKEGAGAAVVVRGDAVGTGREGATVWRQNKSFPRLSFFAATSCHVIFGARSLKFCGQRQSEAAETTVYCNEPTRTYVPCMDRQGWEGLICCTSRLRAQCDQSREHKKDVTFKSGCTNERHLGQRRTSKSKAPYSPPVERCMKFSCVFSEPYA